MTTYCTFIRDKNINTIHRNSNTVNRETQNSDLPFFYMQSIDTIGKPAGDALKLAGVTCGALEATSAGLISACLQSVPRASKFWAGSVTIYSAKAGKAFVPLELRRELGKPKDNYSSASNYIESKKVFTKVLGQHFKTKMNVDWFVSESGAAEASSLFPVLKAAGAFSVVTVLGPNNFCVQKVIRGGAKDSRVENMWLYTKGALKLLEESVKKVHQNSSCKL